MKQKKYITIAALLGVVTIAMLATGCADTPDANMAAKYTEQTAQAIVDGSWKIAGSLLFGLILNGVLSS